MRRACYALLFITAAGPGWATDPDDGASGTVYAGVEVGNSDSHRFDAGTSWRFAESWSASALISRSRFEGVEDTYDSTLVSARAGHDFGPAGAELGVRKGEIEAVSDNTAWFAAGFADIGAVRLSVEVETRSTDLAPSAFTEDLGAGLGVRSGISRCAVDSLGYQARVDLDRPGWAGFVSWRTVDYSAFDCELTLVSGPPGPPERARGRALGRRLGALPLQPVRGLTSQRTPRDVVLLESSAAVGVIAPVAGQWLGGAELSRDEEFVGGGDYLTSLVFANRPLTPRWTLEMTLGFTDADTVDDTTFAGLRFSAQL